MTSPKINLSVYHDGHRQLQDQFDSRRIADRLAQHTYRNALTDGDRNFIEGASMFFLATADPDGNPDCSYKGGDPGFVRVVSANEIAWPDYDGNGQFRSLGNVAVHSPVALLFIDWTRPNRLRLHGHARLCFEDPLLADMPGGQLVVRVSIERVFPNCPRYIHTMQEVARSPYVPHEGEDAPVPGWKKNELFADALPVRAKADE
ncbi:MAG TPA: pyridoxamine 5'-phosphate oxidase family protein [Kofleriaceae bacterium]|nr:pyridoxamine 5'-phosphate oxidase family protein [Kofleriaceae bacterium]